MLSIFYLSIHPSIHPFIGGSFCIVHGDECIVIVVVIVIVIIVVVVVITIYPRSVQDPRGIHSSSTFNKTSYLDYP